MRNKKINKLLLFFWVFSSTICTVKAMDWDWDNIEINIDKLSFENKKTKEPFLFGVATSAYQVEGTDGATVMPYNQWNRLEGKEIEIDGTMCKPVPHKSGNACEHYKRYKSDIQLMKDLGFKAYRFSISWGKVEPESGTYNQDVLDHYEDVCKELVDNGIKPLITLYHYTHPCWFEDKGGFEKEENLEDFVNFCVKVFERLNKYNPVWFTFCSYIGYAFPAYFMGFKPPFKKDMQLSLDVMKHMLDTHVRVYHRLKSIDKTAKVGIHKTVYMIDPYCRWNPLDLMYSWFGNKMQNYAIYDFFTTGVYKVWMPGKAYIKYENEKAKGALDCIGLTYYSAAYAKNSKIIPRPECMPTENERYTMYPQGFYRTLHQVNDYLAKPLHVPIYVTETGIAAKSDEDRDIFFKRHLYVLSKALQDGIDIRSYCCWSLMDNFEWSYGYTKKYGICRVNFETQERTLKKGAEFLVEVAKKYGEK